MGSKERWNFTLPSLTDYLESVLALKAHRNKSDFEILQNFNSSFFHFGNLSRILSKVSSTEFPSTRINKPIFSFNINFTKKMMPSSVSPERIINASLEEMINGELGSTAAAESHFGWDSSSSFTLNESFAQLDNAWWLPDNRTFLNGSNINGTQESNLITVVTTVLVSTVLACMILTTIIGNVFVIAAILLERNLQQVANYLIVSLAVADLLVAILVMPLGALYEVRDEWILGPELCDMWTSADVLCSSASILHLVAIALDRYWAVTRIDYIHSRNKTRIGAMILMTWLTAIIVSIGPLFGWKDAEFNFRVNEQKKCLVSQDLSYQIFATMATFYVPLTAILILYWKIYQAARKRIRKRPGRQEAKAGLYNGNKPITNSPKLNGGLQVETTAFITESSGTAVTIPLTIPERSSPENSSGRFSGPSNILIERVADQNDKINVPKKSKKELLEAKREKKAAKTLAIITGVFVICWLPFFVTVIIMSFCPTCWMNDVMISLFLWLGYLNSTLNPIIYTIFSPDFRQAFKRILCTRRNNRRYIPGTR